MLSGVNLSRLSSSDIMVLSLFFNAAGGTFSFELIFLKDLEKALARSSLLLISFESKLL